MLLANPLNMDTVSEEFLIELVEECHCDNILKQKYTEVRVSDFYQFLPNCFFFIFAHYGHVWKYLCL